MNTEAAKDPNLNTDLTYESKTREEKMYTWWRVISAAYNNPVLGPKYFYNNA